MPKGKGHLLSHCGPSPSRPMEGASDEWRWWRLRESSGSGSGSGRGLGVCVCSTSRIAVVSLVIQCYLQ